MKARAANLLALFNDCEARCALKMDWTRTVAQCSRGGSEMVFWPMIQPKRHLCLAVIPWTTVSRRAWLDVGFALGGRFVPDSSPSFAVLYWQCLDGEACNSI